jgi:hypothetical protein
MVYFELTISYFVSNKVTVDTSSMIRRADMKNACGRRRMPTGFCLLRFEVRRKRCRARRRWEDIKMDL